MSRKNSLGVAQSPKKLTTGQRLLYLSLFSCHFSQRRRERSGARRRSCGAPERQFTVASRSCSPPAHLTLTWARVGFSMDLLISLLQWRMSVAVCESGDLSTPPAHPGYLTNGYNQVGKLQSSERRFVPGGISWCSSGDMRFRLLTRSGGCGQTMEQLKMRPLHQPQSGRLTNRTKLEPRRFTG